MQGQTLESLLKSTSGGGGLDGFGEHNGPGQVLNNLMSGMGNGASLSPLSGVNITPQSNVTTPNKNSEFGGGYHGPVGAVGDMGSAGKGLTATTGGYSLDPNITRTNDPAVNSVRRNMNTMWGNSNSISSKKWNEDM